TDTLAALISLATLALLLRVWRPREEYVEHHGAAVTTGGAVVGVGTVPAVDAPARVVRAYATYGILVVTVLIGQVGNFAGMATLKPPANVTALLKCGQIGNRLCPDPWIGQNASVDPQGFRFPVWEFNWPGSYGIQDGKPAPLIRRESPIVGQSTPYALTFRLDFLAAAGTLVGLAALLAFVPMAIAGMPTRTLVTTFVRTLRQLRLPI